MAVAKINELILSLLTFTDQQASPKLEKSTRLLAETLFNAILHNLLP